MSMDEQALKSMAKMITALLPYELGYEPVSKGGKAVNEIFTLLREKNPKFSEFEGFLGFVLKKMDTDESKDLSGILGELREIVDKYYPPGEHD